MANPDQVLSLLLQMKVVGNDDVAAARDLLKENKEAAQDLATSVPENLKPFEGVRTNASEAREEVEGLGESVHGLSRGAGFAGLTEQAHLLHAALNPITLTITGIAVGMETFFGWQEKALDRQREMILELQKYNDYLRELIKLRGDANAIEVEHAQNLAKARVEAQGLSADLARTNDLQRVFAEEQKNAQNERNANSKRENDLIGERITLLESVGLLNKSQVEQAKLAADHQQRLADILNSVSDKKAAVTSSDSALNDVVKKLTDAGYQVNGNATGGFSVSPAQVATADDHASNAKRDATFNEQVVKDGENRLRDLEEQRDAQERRRSQHGTEYDPATGGLVSQGATQQIDALNQQIDTQKHLIETAKTNLQGAEDAAAATADTAKVLHEANKTLSDLFAGLTAARNELQQAQSQGTKDTSAENQRYAIESIAALIKNGATPNSIFNNGVNAMSVLDHMQENTGFGPDYFLKQGTPQQKEYVTQLRNQVAALEQMENAVGNQGGDVVRAINSVVKQYSSGSADIHAATMTWMQGLNTQFAKMRQQIESMSFSTK
jgi:hypothetical protein